MWIPFEAKPQIPHIPGGVYGVPVNYVSDPAYKEDMQHQTEAVRRRAAMLVEMANALGLGKSVTYDDVSRGYGPTGLLAPGIISRQLLAKVAQTTLAQGGIPVTLINTRSAAQDEAPTQTHPLRETKEEHPEN